MKTRMVQFRVDKNLHFFEILEEDKIIYISDPYEELEECVDVGTHMMNVFHDENPLRETEIPQTVNPRIFYRPKHTAEE